MGPRWFCCACRPSNVRKSTVEPAIKPGYKVTLPDDCMLVFQQKVGQGGFGAVYKSELRDADGQFRGLFAAKVLSIQAVERKRSFERERIKIRREVDILSRVYHGGIVNLHYLITQNRRWVIMLLDWMAGGTLFSVMTSQRRGFSEATTRFICVQLIHTLQYLHAQGIIHRDIKLDNILVERKLTPGYYQVRLADFGLANVAEPVWGKLGSKVGTIQYLSPEMINTKLIGSTYGCETDVWSLGVVLYVMISQCYPFGAEESTLRGAVDFREAVWDSISDECREVIEGMLTLDAVARWTLSDTLNSDWIAQLADDADAPPVPETEELVRPKPVVTNLVDINCIGDDWVQEISSPI